MKLNIQSVIIIFLFTSCTATHKLSIRKNETNYYYQQKSPPVTIQLLGDYYFQPLKTKYFRDVDKRFLQYATSSLHKAKPSILYKAHTIVQPYYSTICLQYKLDAADTVTLGTLYTMLKIHLPQKTEKFTSLKYGSQEICKFKYQVTDSRNKTTSSHTEYFLRKGRFLYRLLFWTTQRDDTVISTEAEQIISEIEFK